MRAQLEKVWTEASLQGEQCQILLAGHKTANNAIHTMAKNANAVVLEWYFEKCKD